jgi:hypothetical protein
MNMRFPERNSRGWTILSTLYRKPMTIWQGIEQHGYFDTVSKPQGIGHDGVLALYCDLVERGCLEREGIQYRLTLAARTQLEKRNAQRTQTNASATIIATTIATVRASTHWTEPGLRTKAEWSGRYTQLNFKISPKQS